MRNLSAILVAIPLLIAIPHYQPSQAQDTVSFDNLELYTNGKPATGVNKQMFEEYNLIQGTVYYQGAPFSGVAVSKYSDNSLKEKVSFRDGNKHGESKYWNQSGILTSRTKYWNGEPDGSHFYYHNDGSISIIEKFDKGLRDGKWESYFPKTASNSEYQLLSTVTYKNDRKTGISEEFFLNGQVSERVSYYNGEVDGTLIKYYDNGQIKERTEYKNGVKHGESKGWYEDGTLSWNRYFENGQRSN